MHDHLKLEDFRLKEAHPDQATHKRNIHLAVYEFAKTLVENTPNVRSRERAFAALMDVRMFADLAIDLGYTVLTPEVLADTFLPTEKRDVRVKRVWLSAKNYGDLRKYGKDKLDTETKIDRLRQGIQGCIFGAEIRTSRKIPEGHVVVIADDQDDFDTNPDWKPATHQLIAI